MQYTIVWSDNDLQFATKVKQLLAEGWELSGGVAISHGEDGDIVFAQALFTEQEPIDKEELSRLLNVPKDRLSVSSEQRDEMAKILQDALDKGTALDSKD